MAQEALAYAQTSLIAGFISETHNAPLERALITELLLLVSTHHPSGSVVVLR